MGNKRERAEGMAQSNEDDGNKHEEMGVSI